MTDPAQSDTLRCWVCGTTVQGPKTADCSMGHLPATMQPDPPDWRTLPATNEAMKYVRDSVRCECGHDPSRHYDMSSYCMACLDEDGFCEEFRDAA